ncbi:MAG TPA: glycosyltransferase [candidate division WOR-3 bacterium]|uniref:Glycosyltransferase n=1 Tax=candidate division WOR-3 bacterium TaxID=2052148 RepID=A0A9C9K0A9_UNCW3|nr:glycosyltransferase [candidate division WOR-3 bacterium]
MKIVFVGQKGVPAKFGGIERHVEELGWRLAERGHSVIVYSRRHYNCFSGIYRNMRVVSLPAIKQKHTEMISHTFLSLFDLLDKKVDIIHIHGVDPALISFIPRLKTKVVVTSHDRAYRREKWGPIAKKFSRMAERVFIVSPHKKIVVSQTLKKYYEEKYDCEVVYIPNGVEIPKEQGSAELGKFGLSKGEYFLFVGRIVPTKGCEILIEAFKRMKTDKKLVFAGGSSYTDSYYERLRRKADKRVLFLGYRYGKELAQLYANAYCFVMPSEVEGLALTLLEAMSYKRCVIYSDIPENVEAARDAGIAFRNKDVDDLAAKIDLALQNPSLCRELGAKARKRVENEYDWDRVVDQTEELYQTLLEE